MSQALIKLGDWYQLIEVTQRQWNDRCVKVLLLEPLSRNEYIIGPQDAGKPIRMLMNEEIYCYFDGATSLNGMPVFVGEVPVQWSAFRCIL